MKREIKFEYGFKSVNGIVKKHYYLHDIPNIKDKCDVWCVLPLLYVRQFTGLKDKNGVDIYEGDIVHYEGITSNGNQVVRKVVYNNERGQFMAEMYQIECPSMVKCTIIGNIHEHGHLLK